jgi:hypothetical protein
MRLAIQILLLLISSTSILAQRPNFGGGGGIPNFSSNATGANNQSQDLEEPDTARIIYFYAQQPKQQYLWADTILSNHFHQYLPTRARQDEYANLGYAGSAAKPLVWQPSRRVGFNLGITAFEPYVFRHEDFKFYLTDRAFSQGKWSFRSLGNDNNLDFEYGNRFKKNIFLSLNWHRLNTTTEGAYKFANQSALNTNWGLSVGQLNHRYQWFLGFTNNSFKHSDNGGISKDIGLIDSDSLPFAGGIKFIPTNARVPINTVYIVRDYQWRHSYQLLGKDTAARNDFLLIHQLNYRTNNFKSYANFNGQAQRADSLFFGTLLKYNKGARLFTEIENIENQFSVAFSRLSKATQLQTVGNNIEIGLRHNWFRVNLEPRLERVQNLFAFSKINFNNFQRFKLNIYSHLGLAAANLGEYRAEGTIFFDLKPVGTLEGKLIQHRFQPSLMERQMFNVQQEVWNNNFNKIFETSLIALYQLPKIGLSASASYHLINNFIYFNKNLIPTQRGEGLSIFQLNISESFKVKHFGMDNFVCFQQTDASAMHLPKLMGKHSIYFEGRILRKKIMLARIGVDFRYVTDYQADSYNPFLAQFYWQDNVSLANYPALDAFFSAKVDKTRVFVKVENLARSFYQKKIYYLIPYYPQYDTYFRIGIQRKFID